MSDLCSVVMDELDLDGVVRDLDDEVALCLQQTGLVEVRPEAGGRWRLLPCGKVGAVRIEDLQVEVRPKEKVGVAHLLFMLGYAKDPGFRPEEVRGIPDDDLWPALAESLARQVERALQHGVLQGYETVEDSLRTVRGRIRFGDQLARRPGLVMPLEVAYDEFTEDTVENRILRTAVRRMLAVPRLRTDVRRRLLHLDLRLEGAAVLPKGSRPPRWVPTRLNARYHAALRLGEIVLRHSSAEAGDGGVRVASFVVSMWEVFEQFVTTALTEALRQHPGWTIAQYRTHLDEPRPGRVRGDIVMDVDVVHVDAQGRPQIIFDAKYKAASPTGAYANVDQYQMLAYCTALRVPVAWLVYAQGGAGGRERRVRHTNKAVVDYPLNLAAPPGAVLRQITDLALSAVCQSGLCTQRAT